MEEGSKEGLNGELGSGRGKVGRGKWGKWGSGDEGKCREESMSEKAGLMVLKAEAETSLISHLVPRDQTSYDQVSNQKGLMEIYSLLANVVYLITVSIVNM